MSDRVERRLVEMLGEPTVSPYGNPIPGLDELGLTPVSPEAPGISLEAAAEQDLSNLTIGRIGEGPQAAAGFLDEAVRTGLVPGATVAVEVVGDAIAVTVDGHTLEISREAARHVFAVQDLENRHD